MIFYDDIIKRLQNGGGVTVYFNHLIDGCNTYGVPYCLYSEVDAVKSRILERYRDCAFDLCPDVFHSSYYRLPKNKKIRTVTTVHDFTYEKYSTGPRLWAHHWQKCRSIKNSDLIICVSHNTAKDLMHYCHVPHTRIRVIYNGVSETYRPLADISNDGQSVLFVGARGGYKNFDMAVAAVAACPDLSLNIVGGGALSRQETIRLDRLLPNRYRWLGRLSDEALNEQYNRAFALIYPSSYEGFGIPILEAMRAGCPVVAVSSSSIPEVAGNGAILVDTPSVANFVDALRALPSMRSQLIEAGFKQASGFSWDKCFQETLAIYRELL